MRKIITIPASLKCCVSMILASVLVSCATQNKVIKTRLKFYRDSEWESPTLPPSAEKRLLETIKGRGILDLYELTYNVGESSYLIIDGLIALETGSIDGYFILRKKTEDKTWENAEVYRWKTEQVKYVDPHGTEIERNLMYGSELIALPEAVLTNLLESVENVLEDSSHERNYNY